MSVCVSVCLSVCLSVCSLLRYRLTVFLPPLPEVGCQIFLEIRNPWGKVMERSGLTFEQFCLEVVKNCSATFFLLILHYKTWWKPRFQMDLRPLVKGRIANFGISLDDFEFLRFGWFFSVFQKNWVLGYSWSTRKPRFPMDKTPLVEGRVANFVIFLDVFEYLRLGWFFPFFKKSGFGVFLVHPPMALVLLSASVERYFVSRMRDFSY